MPDKSMSQSIMPGTGPDGGEHRRFVDEGHDLDEGGDVIGSGDSRAAVVRRAESAVLERVPAGALRARTRLASGGGGLRTRRSVLALMGAAGAAVVLAGCASPGSQNTEALTVFAAASLIQPFDAMASAFEQQNPGVDVVTSYASGSTLAMQIQAGARPDVFATADPESMAMAGERIARPPSGFASNTLTVAVPAGNPDGVAGVTDLARPELRVGLCDPAAPCGRLAAETLTVNGVVAAVDSFEPNNQALFTRLQQGELDAALVYSSDVHNAAGVVESFPLPAGRAPVDVYEVAALRDAPNATQAQTFVDFVLSAEGQAVLHRFGFGQP